MATDVVKLDFPDRDLFILADGDYNGWRSIPCQKEPETVEWIRGFEDDQTLWDVGASVGPYSLIAAALGHLVYAFEPFPPSYGQLVTNLYMNHEDNGEMYAYPIALSLIDEFDAFFTVSSMEPGSASHNKDKKVYGFPVITRRADTFCDAVTVPPDHVKIDVDGAELGVIEGGRETWKQVKSIMVESEPPTIDDITVILDGAGLTLKDSWKRWGETKTRNYLYERQ